MSLLQRRAVCTVHDDQGGTCGREDQCTRVVTVDTDGKVQHEHWVCGGCRRRMSLPEWDVTLSLAEGETRRFE